MTTEPSELGPEYAALSRRVLSEYARLVEEIHDRGAAPLVDLRALKLARLNPPFARDVHAVAAEQAAEEWARSYGVWLEEYGPDANTMAGYTHSATADGWRMLAIAKVYLVLFYVDDVMGNDWHKDLDEDRRKFVERTTRDLLALLRDGWKDLDRACANRQAGVLGAVKDILLDLREGSTGAWMEDFTKTTAEYLADTVVDQNRDVAVGAFDGAATRGRYLPLRGRVNGMFIPVRLAEFASGMFLAKDDLHGDVRAALETLDDACVNVGGLFNDLFSFEKEVVDRRDLFNIVPVLMRQRGIGVRAAIDDAIDLANSYVDDFDRAASEIESMIGEDTDPELAAYLRQMRAAFDSCWTWQLKTDRYQRERSIFAQTDARWRRTNGLAGCLKSGRYSAHDVARR